MRTLHFSFNTNNELFSNNYNDSKDPLKYRISPYHHANGILLGSNIKNPKGHISPCEWSTIDLHNQDSQYIYSHLDNRILLGFQLLKCTHNYMNNQMGSNSIFLI